MPTLAEIISIQQNKLRELRGHPLNYGDSISISVGYSACRYPRELHSTPGRSFVAGIVAGGLKARPLSSVFQKHGLPSNYALYCENDIYLNPVRAEMVEHPADYRWSSYRAFVVVGKIGSQEWIDRSLPAGFGKDTRKAVTAYQSFVEDIERAEIDNHAEQIVGGCDHGCFSSCFSLPNVASAQ